MERLTHKTIIGTYMPERDTGAQAIFDKLGPLEDAEAEGRLYITPCPIGAAVYTIRLFDARFDEFVYEISETEYTPANRQTPEADFEKYWFLTKAEAEDALEAWNYIGYEIECVDGRCRERYIHMDQEEAFLLTLGAHRHLAHRKEAARADPAQA